MHHHNRERLRAHASIAVLHLHLAAPTVPMPVAWRFGLRSARFLQEAGQGRGLLPPGCACLTHSAGAWDEGDEAHPMFQTPAEGAATLGLAIGDAPTHPVHAQRATLLNRQGRFHPLTAVALPPADTEGHTTSPAHA